MPRHSLRRPAARRASAPPRVLPATWLPNLTTARFVCTGLQLDLLFYLIDLFPNKKWLKFTADFDN